MHVDVAIVGAGPAGLAAAVAARASGASVVVVDEYAAAGGQIWRRRFDGSGPLPAEARARIAAFEGSGATLLAGRTVWGVPEPGVLLLADSGSGSGGGDSGSGGSEGSGSGDGPGRVVARAIVLATGAYDRPVAFPGWTLPGVMTAGGAQALAKGQGVLPGRRVLLAGAGPFLLPVAAQLAAGGAELVAVVEATRRREWLAAGRRMAAYPDRLAEYLRYRAKVPKVVWGHVIVRAQGDQRVRRATIARADSEWAPAGRERSFEVDAVCTAYGFTPSVELARALGCELRADGVAYDEDMATSVPGVFVAGEAAGVGGAELALVEGELAGWAAAAHAATSPRSSDRAADAPAPSDRAVAPDGDSLRPPDRAADAPAPSDRAVAPDGDSLRPPGLAAVSPPPPDLVSLRARRAKLAGFVSILSELFDPRPGVLSLAAPDTVLCRCEDVTAGTVDAAAASGATTLSALKVVTRCGQGPCQGRVCERLVAARAPEPGGFSARAPVRPVALGDLIDAS